MKRRKKRIKGRRSRNTGGKGWKERSQGSKEGGQKKKIYMKFQTIRKVVGR